MKLDGVNGSLHASQDSVSKDGNNPVYMIKDRVLRPLLLASPLYVAWNFLFPVVHFLSALCELSTICRQSTCLCIANLRALESIVSTCYTKKALTTSQPTREFMSRKSFLTTEMVSTFYSFPALHITQNS